MDGFTESHPNLDSDLANRISQSLLCLAGSEDRPVVRSCAVKAYLSAGSINRSIEIF